MVDIDQFCGRHDDREWMHSPWRHDGKIYATDGHTLIVIADDGRELPGEPSMNHAEVMKSLVKFEAACADFTLAAIPDLPPADPCGVCDGDGGATECLDCDGDGCDCCESGIVADMDGNCDLCHGCDCCESGIVADMDGNCDLCHGSKVAHSQPVKIADVSFSRRLLARLQALPGCCALHVTGKEKVSKFTFDGGYGFIMPMRD